jgi:AraC-like DNA-binding protein
MPRAEGFVGQRLQVVPRPLVAAALQRPATSRLVVTDCGYFPRAAGHGRLRERGAAQAILILVTDGAGWGVVDGERHPLSSGQVLVIPAGVAHEYGADDTHPWTIWWMHVTGPDVPHLLQSARLSSARPVITLREPHKVAALIERALERLERDDSVPSMIGASGAAWHVLALLSADQVSGRAHLDPVDVTLDYLQARVGRRVSVEEVADLVGLSQSRISEVFRAATGTSVLAYQTRLRMARARELLDTSDMGVASVARAVGYEDAYYFSRHFSRVHGQSPSQYRAHDKG